MSVLSHFLERSVDYVTLDFKDGELPIGYRWKIYSLLNEEYPEKSQIIQSQMALKVCESVLPIWEAALPENKIPHHDIDLAREALRGNKKDDFTARGYYQYLELTADDDNYDADRDMFLYVAPCAELTLKVCWMGEFIDMSIVDESDLDGYIYVTFEYSDPVSYAACATGGFDTGEVYDREKLRAFWLWWLTEVIPNAIAENT
jgi:Immunity protein Imm5